MSRLDLKLSGVLALAGAVALGACSKTDGPPTGFGVNVTVDATMVSSAERAKVTSGKLTVVSASNPVVRTVDGLPNAIKSGTVRFHYTPGTGVSAGDKLTFGLDALAGSRLVASGTGGPVTLTTGAVSVTITLVGAGDGGAPPDGEGTDGNPNGKSNGTACVTNDECGTGFCTDGVCCNEECNDVCVSCNQTGSKGTCTPYAVNTDPEMECIAKLPTAPPDDGGAAPEAGAEAGAEAGGAVDAGAATDADTTDAIVINTPDGGFVTMPKSCGGTCGGARACKYPGPETSCGKTFCNTASEQAAFVCDGNGSCGPLLTECQAYSCDDGTGACRTTCSDPTHCLAADYCGAAQNGLACLPKKGNSISCTLPSECASGNCSGAAGAKVCCNTACDGMGLTCTEAGHVGQCQCLGVTCPANVACQVFYADADHDKFGDATGTIANGRAAAGCSGSPPAGFVADNTDCDDGNSNAFPTQTGFFGTPRTNGTYDYNCNGSDDKQTHEYVGGVCRFCGGTANCAATTTSCSGTTATGSFQCPLESTGITKIPLSSEENDASPGLTSRAQAVLPPIRPPIIFECCGCNPDDKSGFVATVKCGAYAYKHTCGACNGTAENADSQLYTQQLCR